MQLGVSSRDLSRDPVDLVMQNLIFQITFYNKIFVLELTRDFVTKSRGQGTRKS